jgi:hypothetical protein
MTGWSRWRGGTWGEPLASARESSVGNVNTQNPCTTRTVTDSCPT